MTLAADSSRSTFPVKILDVFINLFLVFLLLTGVYYRFNWGAWNQGTNLHPDEYGLTNTLTQLKLPATWTDYFNTRISPLSPYPQYGPDGQALKDGPDNRLRWGQWPITFIRAAGEASNQTGYDEIRLLGRKLSALADTLTLVLIFLIGRRLFGWRVGLLATALSSLAVMQIQQSHFMTVDNFGVFFTSLAMYACVRIAQQPCTARPNGSNSASTTALPYQPSLGALQWYLLFGVAFGMAVATRINLLPLGGMVLIAALIGLADQKLRLRSDLLRIFGFAALYMAVAVITSLVVFRVTQPMSFRAMTGDTSLLTLHLNPDWLESMSVAQNESNGVGGGPPAEQWAHRPALLFPLSNMVLWGMGLPLGIAAWAGLLWALWQLLRRREDWRVHLLPLVWTGGYFLFMGTRWVKSVRYFLPVYPFLCLFAAWGIAQLWRRRSALSEEEPYAPAWTRPSFAAVLCLVVVTLGTLAWANAFVSAVYREDHTRIQATRWIFQNVPGAFHLALVGPNGQVTYAPVAAPEGLEIAPPFAFSQSFTPVVSGSLSGILIPHAASSGGPARLRVVIAADAEGKMVIASTELSIDAAAQNLPWPQAQANFNQGRLEAGKTYYLLASTSGSESIHLARSVLSNEDWDEGLPVPFDGRDPFGGLYRGLEMNVRWMDDQNKRDMFIDRLAQVDYVILPSQRGIWSTCRLPLTYPMTMAFYRALFDGSLGFAKVAQFGAPLQIGLLSISDVGGTLAWGKTAQLPLFNHNFFAAEEAFSVYDHPPVWIFKKRPDFNLQAVKDVLNAIDLSQVVVQSPANATGDYCP